MDTVAAVIGGEDAKNRFKSLPVKGAFSLSADTDVRVSAGSASYHVLANSAVLFTVMDFEKSATMTSSHHDPSGINKRLIKPDTDEIDIEALRSVVVKSHGIRSEMRIAWSHQVEVIPTTDSHVSFIFNMLISWYKALLYQAAKPDEKRSKGANSWAHVSLRRYNYSDSHITVTKNLNEDAQLDVEIEVGPPNKYDMEAGDAPDPFGFDGMVTTKRDVLLFPHISKYAYSFYALHVMGRDKQSHVNFDLRIEGISGHDFATRTTGPSDAQYAETSEVDWTDADSMWYWLCEYVNVNRVDNHFAAAFELLASLAYRPVGDTAEGHLYREAVTQVYIPRPSYYRARFPGLLDGEPFSVPHEAKSTMLKAASHAHSLLQMAGLGNYVAHIGAVAAACEWLFIEDNARSALSMSMSANSWLRKTREFRAGAISAVLGKEVPTHFPTEVGVTYPVIEYLDLGIWPHARPTNAESDLTGFLFTEGIGLDVTLTPNLPSSPALLYGKVSEQLQLLAHCLPMMDYGFVSRDSELDVIQAYKLANLYRLAGYRVGLENVQTGDLLYPYSSLNAISVQFTSMEFSARRNTTYRMMDFGIRNVERTPRLPPPEVIMDIGHMNVSAITGNYRTEVPGKRGIMITSNYRRQRTLKQVTVRVSEGQAVVAHVVRPKMPAAPKVEADFHVESTRDPDQPQEITMTLEQE